jgi:hypothetical protein
MAEDSSSDTSSDEEIFAVVIKDGSYFIKAGFSPDDTPRAVFPACIGHSRGSGYVRGLSLDRTGRPHSRRAALVHEEEVRARAEAERALRMLVARRRLALGKLLHARLGAAVTALMDGDVDVLAVLAHACITSRGEDVFAQEMEVADHVRGSVAALAAQLWRDRQSERMRAAASFGSRPVLAGSGMDDDDDDLYVGHEASSRELRQQTFPLTRGLVNDWVMMEKIWRHTFFNELRQLFLFCCQHCPLLSLLSMLFASLLLSSFVRLKLLCFCCVASGVAPEEHNVLWAGKMVKHFLHGCCLYAHILCELLLLS